MTPDLESLFYPEGIALIGVSSDPSKRAGRPLRFLKQWFNGTIYPVNPNYDEIEGIPCYSNIAEISDPVDVALITLPARLVPKVVDECGDASVPNCIVVSAGFAEAGDEGERLQDELLEVVSKHDINVVGPNCSGLINFLNGMIASYGNPIVNNQLLAGSAGIVSQSGALGGMINRIAQSRSAGLSYMVSTGNEADLSSLDYVEYMIDEGKVNVIGNYIEGISDGRRLLELARKAAKKRIPIIALKSGKSSEGSRAAVTHTASMTGDYDVYKGVFRQSGVIPVDSIHELVDCFQVFQNGAFESKNIGVITGSGAAGIEIADAVSTTELNLPSYSNETIEQVEKLAGSRVHVTNPLDLAGAINPSEYDEVVRAVGNDPNVDVVVIFNTKYGDWGITSAEQINEADSELDVPVVVVWPIPRRLTDGGRDLLESNGVPVISDIGRAVTVLERMRWYNNYVSVRELDGEDTEQNELQVIEGLDIPKENSVISEYEAKKFLSEIGLSTPAEHLIKDPEGAHQLPDELGSSVVMKVVSPHIPHRFKDGLVKIDVPVEQVASTYSELVDRAQRIHPKAVIEGVVVQEFLDPDSSVEIIIGSVHDATFGPAVMVAPGGVFTEQLGNTAYRIAPLTRRDALDMIDEIAIEQFYDKPIARADLVKTLVKIGHLIAEYPWIDELDCNPVIVTEDDITVVDALVRTRSVDE